MNASASRTPRQAAVPAESEPSGDDRSSGTQRATATDDESGQEHGKAPDVVQLDAALLVGTLAAGMRLPVAELESVDVGSSVDRGPR